MNWADVTAPPSPKTLRQFAALWLIFFVTLALWRGLHGHHGLDVVALGALGLSIGTLGLARPASIRFVYTGWMIAAFPLGWTISRIILAALFYGVFTPVAVVFRMIGRDSLQVRRRGDLGTYWKPKPSVSDQRDYFRQS